MNREPRERIRAAFERRVTTLARMPGIGQGTAVTRVQLRLQDGLACDVQDGPWKFTADMSEKSGGSGIGPDPGVYGRGALGACMAMAYAFWAAQHGIVLDRLEIEIQADYDVRGTFGVDEVAPEYRQVRCIVTIDSPAPRDAVLRMMDDADAHSPYVGVFRRPIDVRREVRFASRPGPE
jgi:uncharacterized OsmC-like protein